MVVTGDRNVGNNRLLILDKTFPIPQNCVIENIDHKLQDGLLTITMPKQTTAAAAATVAPPFKEPEQTAPEKGREEISPENTTPPPKEPEQTTPQKGGEEISPENAAPPPKEPEQTTPQKGGQETSSENAAPPEAKEEIMQTVEENKGKSAELQKQASAKAEEEAPTPAPAVVPPPVKSPAEGGSGEAKTTSDEKISSPDQKLTEKKEIENQNGEKGKESKTEEVGKNREEPKIGTGSRSPGATGVGKLAGGYTVRRMPLLVTASLAAAVVTSVAAYFAYAYYGLSFAME